MLSSSNRCFSCTVEADDYSFMSLKVFEVCLGRIKVHGSETVSICWHINRKFCEQARRNWFLSNYRHFRSDFHKCFVIYFLSEWHVLQMHHANSKRASEHILKQINWCVQALLLNNESKVECNDRKDDRAMMPLCLILDENIYDFMLMIVCMLVKSQHVNQNWEKTISRIFG